MCHNSQKKVHRWVSAGQHWNGYCTVWHAITATSTHIKGVLISVNLGILNWSYIIRQLSTKKTQIKNKKIKCCRSSSSLLHGTLRSHCFSPSASLFSCIGLTLRGKCSLRQQWRLCLSPSLRRDGDPVVMLTPCVREFSCRFFPFHSVVNSGAFSRAWWTSPRSDTAIAQLSPSRVHAFMTSSGCDQYSSMHVQELHSAGGSVTCFFASIFAPRICQVHGNKRWLQFKPRARGKACSLPCHAGTIKLAIFVAIDSSLATATAGCKRLWNIELMSMTHWMKVDHQLFKKKNTFWLRFTHRTNV